MAERYRASDDGVIGNLTSRSSLRAAKSAFDVYMTHEGFTENTKKAFQSDLNIFASFIGTWTPIGELSTSDLEQFADWLVEDRDAPCSPKSLARRITTLKVFFGWLADSGILPHDPAAPVVHEPVNTPLPDILTPDQIERVLSVTEALRAAEDPDPRPHLLVTLLLHTGIKKAECMAITTNHIDLADSADPLLWIRYTNPQRRHKERKLHLPSWWPTVLAEYQAQYEPQEALFPCTARNLEYVLSNVAERARISQGISFEMLRWTCAVRDYKAGMTSNDLRQKLGLSKVTWRQTKQKIAGLAGPFVEEEEGSY
ncbi:MAG: tyrosine-type recombinase/integrase [Chloroflexota bacterium]